MAQTAVPAMAARYADIGGHWSEQFVELLSSKGIINGDNYGNFRPDDYVKADEFIKLVLAASGFEAKAYSGYWATPYIDEAKKRELVYDDEFQNFQKPITRGEAARIMVRALGWEDMNVPNSSSVIKEITDYYDTLNDYKEYILIAYANNLMKGYEDNSFRYTKPITRGESAVVVTRMLKIKPLDGDTPP